MRDSMTTLWREASMLKRGLLAGGPVVVAAIIAAVIAFTAFSSGSDADEQVVAAPTATSTRTATPIPPTPTPVPPTETPVPAPPVSSSGATGGGGGGGGAAPSGAAAPRPYVPQPALTGPGPITGTDMSLVIPSIGVNAAVSARTVGGNGQMGDPSGPWMVLWYDFSAWGGLGGYPGQPGANAVFAGHVDYIRVGPAVFYSIKSLAPGDQITVNTSNGPITYAVDWQAWAGPGEDFTGYVASTGQEVITLVTCIGSFSGGHYSNRLIVRGHRI